MADRLRTDIDPSQVTVDNAKSFLDETQGAIDVIQTVDIPTLESNIQNMENVFSKKMRFISETQPEPAEKGMAWFVQSEEQTENNNDDDGN